MQPIFKKVYTDPEDIDIITNTAVLDSLIGREAVPAKEGVPAKEAVHGIFLALNDNLVCLDLLKICSYLISNYHGKLAEYKKVLISVHRASYAFWFVNKLPLSIL